MTTKTRVAFVGSGGIAARHAGALAALGDVEIVGVAALDEASARPLAQQYGAKAYGDHRKMMDELKPEALFICVTPSAHGDIERAAIERRIPFFVEKPLAIDYPTAEAIAREVAKAGLVTGVGYQWRYHPTVERAREALAGKTVHYAQGFWLTTTPGAPWWQRKEKSGGQMIEQLTHMFDLARYFLGEPVSVYAATKQVGRASHPECNVEEVSAATVTFQNGSVATIASTCLLPISYRVQMHLFAENLAIEIGPAAVLVDNGREKIEYRGDPESTGREDRAFLDAVKKKAPTLVRSSYADALKSHRLVTLAVESARTGQAMHLTGDAAVAQAG